MSKIKSRDTKPEKSVRSTLFKSGLRFLVCDRRFPGSPDMLFPRYFAAVFVNGCFWHGHRNCRLFRIPHSNVRFWRKKISGNRKRDKSVLEAYREMGWRVCVVWECALRGKIQRLKVSDVAERISRWLEEGEEAVLEIRG